MTQFQLRNDAVDAGRELLGRMMGEKPELDSLLTDIRRAFDLTIQCIASDGTIYLCGNGGSHADACHIAGELMKSFERSRPVSGPVRERLGELFPGEGVEDVLEVGIRAIALGNNVSLSSAIANDFPLSDMTFAQEIFALGRPGDILLGLSTSGNATNVGRAVGVARAMGIQTIGLTGVDGGALAEKADLCLRFPARITRLIQEYHESFYHALCLALEAACWPQGQREQVIGNE